MQYFRKFPAVLLGLCLASASTGAGVLEKDPRVERREKLGSKALSLLYSSMQSDDADVRVLACEQWATIGNTVAVPLLKRALEDKNPYVRIAAAGSLYQLGEKAGVKTVEAIVEARPKRPKEGDLLSELDEMRYLALNKVRVVAVRALRAMKAPGSEAVLRKALGDPDGSVRDAASIALASYGERMELAKHLEALRDDDPQVRAQAVRALGEAANASVIAHLKPLAEDPVSQVRAAVMESLGATGDVLALPELSGGLKDQNELVQAKAVAALGRVVSPSAIPFLEEALRASPNAYIELLAIAGLARLGQKVDLGVARRALAQPDADTRVLAVEVLETVGGEAAIEDLEFAVEDRELRVRARAAAALVKLLQKT